MTKQISQFSAVASVTDDLKFAAQLNLGDLNVRPTALQIKSYTLNGLDTSQVAENSSRLYFTNARAIGAALTGYISGAGTVGQSDSILQAIQKINGNIGALTTAQIAENVNYLYFTNARAIAASLTSFSASSGGTVSSTDSTLTALQKHEYRLNALTPFGGGVRTVTANDTLLLTDFGKKIIFNSATAITFTLPQTSATAIAAGFSCFYENIGSGDVTFVKQGSETLSGNTLAAQNSQGMIYRNSTTAWALAGGTKLEPASKKIFLQAFLAQAYDVEISLESNFTITTIAAKTRFGSVTVTPKSVVGGVENAMSTSATLVAADTGATVVTVSSNNALLQGDGITMTLSSLTGSPERLMVQFIGYRRSNVW